MSNKIARFSSAIAGRDSLSKRCLKHLTSAVWRTKRRRMKARVSQIEQLELRQLMTAAIWTNVLQPLDVSGGPNSVISPIDALLVINELNNPVYAPRSQPLPLEVDDNLQTSFVDVTCDGRVSPLDALLVINSLNAGNTATGNPIAGAPTWHFASSGGTTSAQGKVIANACSPRLVEGDSYSAELSATVTLPSANTAVRVQFSAPSFDMASKNSIRDAFEILVLDRNDQPLTLPFSPQHDASFNWSEGVDPAVSVGTQSTIQPANLVSNAVFNLSGIAAGTAVKIVVRLINNDSDSVSSVTLRNLELITAGGPAPTGMSYPNVAQATATAVDPNVLTDVSTNVVPLYGQTSLYDDSHVLVTELQMLNQSTSAISGRVIVAIDRLSDPTISVLNPDGFLPGGRPYFVLNSASASAWLGAGERTEKRELRFRNGSGQQFTYSLTTLAELNQAPTGFTSTPFREIEAGRLVSMDVQATDPDGQMLTYRIDAGPDTMAIDANTGHLTWQTTTADVGNHSIILRATDPYGLSVTQSFLLAVIETLPNRPPVFTSTPSTVAKVAGSFEVNTFRVGDQPVAIAGGLFDGQNYQIATVNTAESDLTIGRNSVSVGEPRPSGLLFQTGQDVDIGFPAFNHPNDANTLEGFTQGDFNQDGNLDFVTVGVYRQYDFRSILTQKHFMSITLGDGQGGFLSSSALTLDLPESEIDHLYHLHAADFNGDGHLDVAGQYRNDHSISGSNAPRVVVYPGRGDGTFATVISTDSAGLRLDRSEIADINGDGKLDIVAVQSDGQRVGTLLGNGDCTFGAYREFANFVGTGTGIYYGVGIGDLDGVNGPDIVLPDWQLQVMTVYLNDGQGGYTRRATLDARQPYWPYGGVGLTRPQTVWIADFDGNGKADILYAASNVSNSYYGGLGIYKGSGDGLNFTYADAASGFQQRPANDHSELIDFNGDGFLDILVGGSAGTSNYTVGVALGRGDGTFQVQEVGLPYAERDFSSTGNYTAETILAGDYNRDGLLDAAVVSSSANGSMIASSSGVTILYADTPGELSAPIALAKSLDAGYGIITITGDVNNDGNQDLLIGAGDRFSTRLGNGDGTFGADFPATPAYYANDPHFASLVDLDHDGFLDLLWSRTQGYQGANQAYMAALGNGDGTFRVTFNLSVPGSFYGAVMIPPADFNGDGYMDFAAYFGSAFSVGTTIDVYLYNSAVAGTFTASYRYIYPGDATPYNASAINSTLTRGDFDNDGLVDLLAVAKKSGPYNNRINFFKGKGDGTFAEPTSVDIFLTNTESSLVDPAWSDSGDLNHDGHRDFVLISAYGNQSVFLGNGDGTFQSPMQYSESFTFGADRAVVLTDIDGDGNLDLSMASERGRKGISIRRGLGDGTFAAPEHYFLTGDSAPGAASYTDIDNDGVTDLVIADNSRPNFTVIYPGTNPGLVAITTTDINGDGHLDALAVNQDDGHVKWLLGQGDGSLVRQPDLLAGKGALALATVDLNSDQKLDIITANRAARSVSVLTSDGTGKFQRRDISIGQLLSDLAVGDLTGDGRADIVVAAAERKSLYLVSNSASGLGTPQAIPTGDEPGKISIADVTGDGQNDIVVSLPLTHRIMILPGNGDGTFNTPQYGMLKEAAGDVAVADFNLDGKPDLAVTLPANDQVAILFARGGGRFSNPQTIKVGDNPASLIVQDVNSDGRPDLLVANSGDDTASEIINRYDPTKVYRYQPAAVDPDGDTVIYDLIDSPGGMLFNETTREILWAPTADQIGLNAVTLSASDGKGGSATQSFSIDVAPNRENRSPIIFSTAPNSLQQDVPYSYTPTAVDLDGETLRFRLIDGPVGASIDATTGEVQWDARNGALTLNSFQYSNGNVSVPHSQSLASPSITVEGSFRFDTLSYNQVLFQKQIYSGGFAIHTFRLWYVNGGLRATIFGQDTRNVVGESDLNVNWNAQVGKWTHLALTFDDATSDLSIYSDGQLLGSLSTGRHLNYDSTPLVLGFENSNPFYGSMANFRIWDSALIQSALRSGINRELPADAPGLLLDYRFLEGDALTVVDHSLHHNNGRRTVDSGWPLPARVPGLAAEQTQSFTIGVEDGKGGVSTQSFSVTVVPPITQVITGVLFRDLNADGLQENDELGIDNSIVFVDANGNGSREADEMYARTSSSGSYTLEGLTKGSYVLVVEHKAGYTLPVSKPVTVDAFSPSTTHWAAVPNSPGLISGLVTLDADNNGVGGEVMELYTSNFADSSPKLDPWSHKILSTSPNGQEFLGEFTNDAVTLTLGTSAAPIPAHDSITVAFDLYILKSWDGSPSPDRWQFQLDVQTLVNTTFSNTSSRQAFPQAYPAGDNSARTGAVASNTLGYTYWGDTVYHFEITMLHTGSTATLTFKGLNLQGASDESWGLDNVRVTSPERPIAGWPVYLDGNNNSVRDVDETVTTTDALGGYAFAGLTSGSYRVRLDNPAGWTTLGAINGTQTVALAANESRLSVNFGLVPDSQAASQPRFTTTPTATIAARDVYRFVNTAVDPAARPIVYSLAASPPGMSIDPTSGTIVWTPTLDQAGEQRVILKATNDHGGVAVQDFSIQVAPPNSSPIITSTPAQQAAVDQVFLYDLLAQDAEQSALEMTLEAAPSGASLDASGRLQWKPAIDQLGPQPFRIKVSDGHGGTATQAFTLDVVSTRTNTPPVIEGELRSDATVGLIYVARLSATDADQDQLTFELVTGPVGLTVSPSGLVSWKPTSGQLGTQAVRVRAKDGLGGMIERDYLIRVSSALTNHAPQFVSQGAVFAVSDKEYRYDVAARDADNDAVGFELLAGPAGLSLDNVHGTMRWLPASDQFGPSTVSLRATDTYGGTAEQSFTISVRSVGGPPAITSVLSTRAAAGVAFLYSVMASDAEGDPLTYSLLEKPLGMTINAITGEIDWTPTTQQLGANEVVIQVSDGVGGFATQAFSIIVAAGVVNQPPAITHAAPIYASVGTQLSYQLSAVDPEGSVITYQLRRGPQAISVNATTGLVTWTPVTSDIGVQVITLAAFDAQGAAAVLSFEIEVLSANIAPVINSHPPVKATARGLYRYDVMATDQNLDPLGYSLADAPPGMTIDAFGRIRWQTTIDDIGAHTTTLSVRDPRGGLATQSIVFTVVPDTTPPRVSVLPLRTIVRSNSPETFAQFNLTPTYPTNRVRVSAVDDVGVANIEVRANGDPVSLDANGYAFFDFKDWGFGSITVTARATDEAGNIGTGSKAFAFLPFGDDPVVSEFPPPSVAITSPTMGSSTRGVVQIRGSATSDNFTSYKLSFRPSNGISTGNVVAGDFDIPDDYSNVTFTTLASSTDRISDGLLGTWDTTVLENGDYVLRLEEEDDVYGTTVYEANVNVDGAFKLGNFRVSFSDLTIPVAGIPITVTRTYDTLTAGQDSELGYGWRFEYRDTNLRTNLPKTGLESFGIYSAFKPGTKVYVTLPGGTREGFTFTPDIRALPGFGGQLVIATPRFTPDRGVKDTLSVRGGTYIVNELGELMGGGGQPYNPAAEEFGGGYSLTTRDGTQYRINGDTGLLMSATDRSNHQVTFTDSGITGSETGLKLERDARGRITKVVDPAGHAIEYSYDSQGNLIRVLDRLGNATTYSYLSSPKHFLDAIIDPLGRTGVRMEYQADGRLKTVKSGSDTVNQLSYDSNLPLVTSTDALGHVRTTGYDDHGNIVSMTDPLGHTSTMTYDDSDNLISETDALGHTKRYTYANGLRLSVTDALGNTTYSTFDAYGQQLSVVNPLGASQSVNYDTTGNPIQITNARGLSASVAYSSGQVEAITVNGHTYDTQSQSGLITQIRDLAGATYSIQYDALRQEVGVQSTDAAFGYSMIRDSDGRPVSVTDKLGATTRFEYDALGNRTAVIDPLGNRTDYEYDKQGLVRKIRYADGTTVVNEHDAVGQLVSQIDQAGNKTAMEYDPLGRRIAIIYPDGTPQNQADNPRTRTEYDAIGNITAEVDPLGHRTSYAYDALNRRIRSTDPTGAVTKFTYDSIGDVLSVVDPLGRKVQYEYDSAGDKIAEHYADGTSTLFSYNQRGNQTSITDPTGNTRRFEYDELGQLIAVIDPLGNRTIYTYDAIGKVSSITDPLGRVTGFEYDMHGRLLSRVLATGERETFVYDKAGNLISRTGLDGKVVTYQYDKLNRRVAEIHADGTSVLTVYSAVGLPTSITAGADVVRFEYDALGRQTKRTDPVGQTVQSVYDVAGNRISIVSAAGTVDYQFDANNRVMTVTSGAASVTRYTYDAAGQLVKTEFPNGTTQTLIRNSRGLVERNQVTGASGELDRFDTTYDAAGRQTSLADLQGRTVTYRYDADGRLVSETTLISGVLSGEISYTYDAAGNRRTMLDTRSGLTMYTYDPRDRLVSETTGAKVVASTYDANGNLLIRGSDSNNMTRHGWDDFGRLVSVEVSKNGDSETVRYTYAPDGQRLAREDAEGTVRFVVDTARQYAETVAETTTTGSLVKAYTLLPDQLGIVSQQQGTQILYVHSDAQHNVLVMTDSQGQVADEFRYQAFGETSLHVGTSVVDRQFQAAPLDPLSGYSYFRSRYYHPQTGRFISADTFYGFVDQPISQNPYVFVSQDPLNRIDPTGHFSLTESQVVMAINTVLFATLGATIGSGIARSKGVSPLTGAIVGGLIGAVLGAGSVIGAGYLFIEGVSTATFTPTVITVSSSAFLVPLAVLDAASVALLTVGTYTLLILGEAVGFITAVEQIRSRADAQTGTNLPFSSLRRTQ